MRHAMPPELRLHVALDYLLVAAGLLAPWVLGFSHHTAATVHALDRVGGAAGVHRRAVVGLS